MKNKAIKNTILNEALHIAFKHAKELVETTDMTDNQIIFAALSRAASEYSDPKLNINELWEVKTEKYRIALFTARKKIVDGCKRTVKRVRIALINM